jgi:hypothetical protein
MRRRWYRLGFATVCALVAAGSLVCIIGMAAPILQNTRPGTDFGDFFAAARALTLWPHTANIYDLQVTTRALPMDTVCRRDPSFPVSYPYPYAFTPLLAILLQPLTGLCCSR